MKRPLVIAAWLIGLILSGVFVYRLATPEITVANASQSEIEEVVIQLPSNRVVFGEVPPGAASTIYYSASQADGAYDYSVRFPGEPVLSGSCGHVTKSDHGKRLQLIILGPESVECRESNKIF
jgi:hypothetical protein